MAPKRDKILAIESSCDDTSVAVVDKWGQVHAWEQESQNHVHLAYGGVVPEVASRYHEKSLQSLAKKVLSSFSPEEMSCVAGTSGPGLVGPLLVGRCFGEGLSRSLGVPFRGIHHLRAHIASVLLASDVGDSQQSLEKRSQEIFPALVLLVSGGHTQILFANEKLEVRRLADTADDSAGECFDKIAKLLGLKYPGGPEIEQKAKLARAQASSFEKAQILISHLPRPRSAEGFSFSGLKTATRLLYEKDPELQTKPEILSFALQEVIADTLRRTLKNSLLKIQEKEQLKSFVFCGGVSANQRIRDVLKAEVEGLGLKSYFPPLKYCTDNAAMVGAAAWVQDSQLDLNEVLARVPL